MKLIYLRIRNPIEFLNLPYLMKMAIVNPLPIVPMIVQTTQAKAPAIHQNASIIDNCETLYR